MPDQKKYLSQVVERRLWPFVVVIVGAESCFLGYLRGDKRSRRSLHISKVAVVHVLC